ncbi:lipopolysaccharide biosynthesis protein [Streptomyces sp. TRM S81-3]|uniref:Lipopolysaccharide biosynthesis protein n=1 Tax=Streptomyces griseicoloratus TaxID=2752516 RepID=A0A926QPV4_9ACTN|nr:lipopolysaccharide biosynthesis protein [Streptomyces griseicoloratus]MBD0418402.1 lipopolysaccharide biosynthesis protein [Streptomyces griseicoloratus]
MTDTPTRRRRLSPARFRRLPSWSVLVAGTLTGGLLGGAYGLLTPETYTATSYVVAVPTSKSTPEAARGFAQAYGRVATQLAVLGDAQVWAGVPVRALQDHVRAVTSPDAPMVAVSATSSRPGLAVDMANAVSRALTQHADHTKGSTQVRLVQFSRAVKPSEPTSASWAVTTAVGASAGGLLGGLALLAGPRRTGRDDEARPAASVPGPATAARVHGKRSGR